MIDIFGEVMFYELPGASDQVQVSMHATGNGRSPRGRVLAMAGVPSHGADNMQAVRCHYDFGQ